MIADRNARLRVIIENVEPEVDCGRFAAKGVVGDPVVVEADIFTDGHEVLRCRLLYRQHESSEWRQSEMKELVNDRWRAAFTPDAAGLWHYTVEGWVDPFATWQHRLKKKAAAGQDIRLDLRDGAAIIRATAGRAQKPDAADLEEWAARLETAARSDGGIEDAVRSEPGDLCGRYPEPGFVTRYDRELRVFADRERARFSAWYEVFPRSCAGEPGRHGTLRDCEARLPYIADMGFDVLYLPPIHPIGRANRKGKNNTTRSQPGDTGSPWAIGAVEGGHKSVHPELGTVEDLERLIARAAERGIEVALDIAFQCAPDHPYVREHPEWFRRRADGSIQYAENPPKKYEDIYPFDFETEQWKALWQELKSVFDFWIARGVKIFRVDNPHTKPFRFWEWVIGELKAQHPDVLFLSEAFTRPKIMYRLAKLGFSQSYTYFAWRNTKYELVEYFTELTRTRVSHFFRPNLWPNTPDILTEYLQVGGRPAFITRLVLAGTLGANYGIYGAAFELCENVPREPGSEEYIDSEKYEIKHRDLNASWSLRELIARVNGARRENAALQSDASLRFHSIDNDQLLSYSKTSPDGSNVVLVIVNLDFRYTQSGWTALDLSALGLKEGVPYQVHDLLSDNRYLWTGARNYVELNPMAIPAHVFRIGQRVRTEKDSEYYA